MIFICNSARYLCFSPVMKRTKIGISDLSWKF